MSEITIDNFKNVYQSGAVKLLVDVRTPAEYSEAHIDGAINMPLDRLDPNALLELKNKRQADKIYLVCKSGGRSMRALQQLAAQNVSDTVSVAGGTEAAINNDFKIIRSGGKAISLERQVRIAAGAIVLFGTIAAYLFNTSLLIIPAFVGAGLMFSGITDTCGMAMILAKCPWNTKACGSCCQTK